MHDLQTAREDHKTLAFDHVTAKHERDKKKGKTEKYPNGNMADAHAEIGIIQQAYDDGHKFDKPTLELRGEKGRFILMLQDFDADGEAEVRTFFNPSPKGDGSIWGDFFGASRIVEDFDLVLRAFCEFAETGNVSHDLMD